MATNESKVIATQVETVGAVVSTLAVSGRAIASRNSPHGPSNITKVTNTPTATKAISLMINSVAIASIKPSWCSAASMWRVPNSMANAAMVSAMNSARSPSAGSIAPVAAPVWARIAPSEDDTALSCSAM